MTDATSQSAYKVTHVLPDQERIITKGVVFGTTSTVWFKDACIEGVAIEVGDIIHMMVRVPVGSITPITTFTLEKAKKPAPAITNVTHLGSFLVKKGKKSIYTLTCIRLKDHEKKAPETRCWGWYSNLEDAKAAVLSNATDMFECHSYDYAVIEEYYEGICQVVKNEWWFFADYEKADRSGDCPNPVVTEIPKPERLDSIVHFGMR